MTCKHCGRAIELHPLLQAGQVWIHSNTGFCLCYIWEREDHGTWAEPMEMEK